MNAPRRSARLAAKYPHLTARDAPKVSEDVKKPVESKPPNVSNQMNFMDSLRVMVRSFDRKASKEERVQHIVKMFDFMRANPTELGKLFGNCPKFMTTLENKIHDLLHQIQDVNMPYRLAVKFHHQSQDILYIINTVRRG
jgi:hypothetical protein